MANLSRIILFLARSLRKKRRLRRVRGNKNWRLAIKINFWCAKTRLNNTREANFSPTFQKRRTNQNGFRDQRNLPSKCL